MIVINVGMWAWPQWTILAFAVLDFLLSIRYHGYPRKPLSAGMDAFKWILLLAFLVAAGFFS